MLVHYLRRKPVFFTPPSFHIIRHGRHRLLARSQTRPSFFLFILVVFSATEKHTRTHAQATVAARKRIHEPPFFVTVVTAPGNRRRTTAANGRKTPCVYLPCVCTGEERYSNYYSRDLGFRRVSFIIFVRPFRAIQTCSFREHRIF